LIGTRMIRTQSLTHRGNDKKLFQRSEINFIMIIL
jgi:hypothetical protein